LRADTSPEVDSFLRFTVQGLGGTPITRARLLVYANSNGVQGVNARAIADNTWDELTTNFGNAPALGNILASSGAFHNRELGHPGRDILHYRRRRLQHWAQFNRPVHPELHSREAATNTPQLILDLQNGDVDTQAPFHPRRTCGGRIRSHPGGFELDSRLR